MSETRDIVAELTAFSNRIAELEGRVKELEAAATQSRPEVTEDVMVAISAACAAYFGERAVIKQVHRRRGGAWASMGRSVVHLSHADMRHHATIGTPDRPTFDRGR
jgi:methylmalonyl-CoA carboxyltransferase 12S subunit